MPAIARSPGARTAVVATGRRHTLGRVPPAAGRCVTMALDGSGRRRRRRRPGRRGRRRREAGRAPLPQGSPHASAHRHRGQGRLRGARVPRRQDLRHRRAGRALPRRLLPLLRFEGGGLPRGGRGAGAAVQPSTRSSSPASTGRPTTRWPNRSGPAIRSFLEEYRAEARIMAVIEQVSRHHEPVRGLRFARYREYLELTEQSLHELQRRGGSTPGSTRASSPPRWWRR